MPIINGRRLTNVPDAGVYGADIIKEMKTSPGRRPVIMKPGGMETIQSDRLYGKRDVLDKKGRPLKVTDIPDRTKGAGNPFEGTRDQRSKTIITEQVVDIATHLYNDDRGVDFDEDDANWFVIPNFRLPLNWHHIAKQTPLLIMFPTIYPAIPPIGCYMRASIPQSPNGHFYKDAYHEASKAPVQDLGWKWFCVYVTPGTWRPAPVRAAGDWKNGDNLWTYLTLINEALASPD